MMDMPGNLPIKKHAIKTFRGNHFNHQFIDSEVNEWIDKNMDVEILSITTACVDGVMVVTIVYLETFDVDWKDVYDEPPEIIAR